MFEFIIPLSHFLPMQTPGGIGHGLHACFVLIILPSISLKLLRMFTGAYCNTHPLFVESVRACLHESKYDQTRNSILRHLSRTMSWRPWNILHFSSSSFTKTPKMIQNYSFTRFEKVRPLSPHTQLFWRNLINTGIVRLPVLKMSKGGRY